jgi:hypothetical protein
MLCRNARGNAVRVAGSSGSSRIDRQGPEVKVGGAVCGVRSTMWREALTTRGGRAPMGHMERLDLRKKLRSLYSASATKPALVEVPELTYLMVDGKGDPNRSAAFQEAVEALFSLSYTLKFLIKRSPGGVDYGVMPLEGLWWADEMGDFLHGSRDGWQWTLMILQPEQVTGELVETARQRAAGKKALPALSQVRLEICGEGPCAQVLHLGPFSEEGPTVGLLHRFIETRGMHPRGKHREIYLSDFRRTAPERLRTILRQPVARV